MAYMLSTVKQMRYSLALEEDWDWVWAQQRAVRGMVEVMEFWCRERQAGDGQLGGGWGDDVEVWRNWTPILLGFKVRELGEMSPSS